MQLPLVPAVCPLALPPPVPGFPPPPPAPEAPVPPTKSLLINVSPVLPVTVNVIEGDACVPVAVEPNSLKFSSMTLGTFSTLTAGSPPAGPSNEEQSLGRPYPPGRQPPYKCAPLGTDVVFNANVAANENSS